MINHQHRSASRLQWVVKADPKNFNSRWVKQLLKSLFPDRLCLPSGFKRNEQNLY